MWFAVEVEVSTTEVRESLLQIEGLRPFVMRVYGQPQRRAARTTCGLRPHHCKKRTPNARPHEMLLNIELVEVGGRWGRSNAGFAEFAHGESDEVARHFRYQGEGI